MQSDSLQNLNAFDWVLIVILAWSTISALLRGFIGVLFSIVGLSLGFLLASWNDDALALWLGRWITSRVTAHALAFVLILVLVVVVVGKAGAFLRGAVSAVGLGFVDRIAGAALGLVRGCLLGVTAFIALNAIAPNSELLIESRLTPYFLQGAHAVSFVVPDDLAQQISHGTSRLKHIEPRWIKPR